MQIFRALMIAVTAMWMYLSGTVTAQGKTIPLPVIYGPPDNSATRVPPPDRSYLPADPAARRESVMSSVLFPPENAKRSVTPEGTFTLPPNAMGPVLPWRLQSEVMIVDPVTTVTILRAGVQ